MPRLLPWLFLGSGLGSLGAQVAWAKLFAIGLGHEVPSVLSVVTTVMLGLALGSALWSLRPSEWSPLRAYACLELAIGLGAILSAFVVLPWCRMVGGWMGVNPGSMVQWGLSFLAPLLILLPSTVAMGATLPAMEAMVQTPRQVTSGSGLGAAYAFNTFGAFLGCLLTAFVVMPALGLWWSLVACGAVNLMCSAVAGWLARVEGATKPVPARAADRAQRVTGGAPVSRRRLLSTLFLTGLLGLGVEVVGIRALSQVFENTIYSFATALAVYLVATALGAAVYHRWIDFRLAAPRLLSHLFAWVALGLILAALFLPRSKSVYGQVYRWAGEGLTGVLLAELTLAAGVFLIPCLVMGGLFVQWVSMARAAGSTPSRAVALNYAGGALAGVIFGLVLLPRMNFLGCFAVLALGYLLLAPSFRTWSWGAAAVSWILLLLSPPDLGLVERPPGSTLVATRAGAMGMVSVVADAAGQRTLRLNNRFQMGGTAAVVAQRRQAHLPLLLHPQARRALFLGPGTGITLGAATTYPELEIDGVELVPEILEMMPLFEPQNLAPQKNPRVKLYAADARRFVQVTAETYDVIVADLFHPAQDGTGALYTREHFQSLRNRLRPGGFVCQWLPLHQMDVATWKMISRTFQSVFRQSEAWLLHFNVDIPVLGLIGRLEEPRGDWAGQLEQRLKTLDPAELRNSGFQNVVQLLGCRLAGPEQLASLTGSGSLNLDAFPRVSFLAPRWMGHPGAGASSTLMMVLDECGRTTGSTRSGVAEHPFQDDGPVRSFIGARDDYLKGLNRESLGEFNPAVELYFQSAEASLYFTASYARLISVIQVMAQADPPRARRLYERLLTVRPDQPLGKKLLGPLFETKSPE
jgi:spermidine synthase